MHLFVHFFANSIHLQIRNSVEQVKKFKRQKLFIRLEKVY